MRLDTRSSRGPRARKRSNRALVNAVRGVFLATGTLLAVLALSPQEWAGKLGAWTSLLLAYLTPLMALLMLTLVILLVMAKQPFVTRLEYISQSEYLGIPDMAPVGIQSRVVGILDRLGQSSHSRTHIARITFLTGRLTLGYLDQIVDKHITRSNWDIRVLILDPESPETDKIGPGAKQEVVASCALLASIKRKTVSQARPAKISWRGFPDLPMVRGFLIDDDHLFFGYFEWQSIDGAWQLHEQNKMLVYARRGDELSTDSIEFFKSWFDYRWEIGRNLDNTE
jgi:hypothetical protein